MLRRSRVQWAARAIQLGVSKCCSGLVDLVVGVGHHRGGGHRLTLAGERFVALAAKHVAQVGDPYCLSKCFRSSRGSQS